MTMHVYVGSKTKIDVTELISGTGRTMIDAQRDALTLARARFHIGDPIALTEHQAAVRKRQLILAELAPKTPATLYQHTPFTRQREDTRYRH